MEENMNRLTTRGVLYLISGSKHLNVAVVSAYSLRKSGYTGSIHIAVGDDAAQEVVSRMAQDNSLHGPYRNFTWHRWQPPTGQRGDNYRAKTFMDGLSPFDETVFLDADTVVRGSLDPLFTPEPFGVTLTAFSDWKSNGRKIPGRIKGWTDVAADDVAEMLSKPYPAINTGVLSWRKSEEANKFFRAWQELCARKNVFINDEITAQLIFWRHAVRVLDSRWNHSPVHDNRTDWTISHFHGKKHVNREQGRKIWLPLYDECVKMNIAGIRDWTPAGDRRLREYLDGKHRDVSSELETEDTLDIQDDEAA